MGLKKCPICELNYIKDDEKYCNICKRNIKGEHDENDGVVMCTECGENPAVKGSELCAMCLREARRLEKLANVSDDNSDNHELNIDNDELDVIEVPLPGDGDIPQNELEEIDKELGGDDDLDEDDEYEDEKYEEKQDR